MFGDGPIHKLEGSFWGVSLVDISVHNIRQGHHVSASVRVTRSDLDGSDQPCCFRREATISIEPQGIHMEYSYFVKAWCHSWLVYFQVRGR